MTSSEGDIRMSKVNANSCGLHSQHRVAPGWLLTEDNKIIRNPWSRNNTIPNSSHSLSSSSSRMHSSSEVVRLPELPKVNIEPLIIAEAKRKFPSVQSMGSSERDESVANHSMAAALLSRPSGGKNLLQLNSTQFPSHGGQLYFDAGNRNSCSSSYSKTANSNQFLHLKYLHQLHELLLQKSPSQDTFQVNSDQLGCVDFTAISDYPQDREKLFSSQPDVPSPNGTIMESDITTLSAPGSVEDASWLQWMNVPDTLDNPYQFAESPFETYDWSKSSEAGLLGGDVWGGCPPLPVDQPCVQSQYKKADHDLTDFDSALSFLSSPVEDSSGATVKYRSSAAPTQTPAAQPSSIHGVKMASAAAQAFMAAAASSASKPTHRRSLDCQELVQSRLTTSIEPRDSALSPPRAVSSPLQSTSETEKKLKRWNSLSSSHSQSQGGGGAASKKRKSREAVWKQAHLCIPDDPLYQELIASANSEQQQWPRTPTEVPLKSPNTSKWERFRKEEEKKTLSPKPSLESQIMDLANEWKGKDTVNCIDLRKIRSTVPLK